MIAKVIVLFSKGIPKDFQVKNYSFIQLPLQYLAKSFQNDEATVLTLTMLSTMAYISQNRREN